MANKLERSWEYLRLHRLSKEIEKRAFEALGRAVASPTPENVEEAHLISLELEMVIKELMDKLENWEIDNESSND